MDARIVSSFLLKYFLHFPQQLYPNPVLIASLQALAKVQQPLIWRDIASVADYYEACLQPDGYKT
jgi:hypothetical protein